MELPRIIKVALVGAVVFYGAIGVVIVGPPDWDRPILTERSGLQPLPHVLLFASLAACVAGTALGHWRSLGVDPWTAAAGEEDVAVRAAADRRFVRFLVSAALVEAGGIFSFVLAVAVRDSRFALLGAGLAATLLVFLPTPPPMPGVDREGTLPGQG